MERVSVTQSHCTMPHSTRSAAPTLRKGEAHGPNPDLDEGAYHLLELRAVLAHVRHQLVDATACVCIAARGELGCWLVRREEALPLWLSRHRLLLLLLLLLMLLLLLLLLVPHGGHAALKASRVWSNRPRVVKLHFRDRVAWVGVHSTATVYQQPFTSSQPPSVDESRGAAKERRATQCSRSGCCASEGMLNGWLHTPVHRMRAKAATAGVLTTSNAQLSTPPTVFVDFSGFSPATAVCTPSTYSLTCHTALRDSSASGVSRRSADHPAGSNRRWQSAHPTLSSRRHA